MNLLFQFLYLQAMDLLTTLAVLVHGGNEGNPLVRLALDVAPSPFFGLLGVKLLAVALGIYCWRYRQRVLTRVNFFFAAVIAWNIVVIIGVSAS
jgi:hypothetical protein